MQDKPKDLIATIKMLDVVIDRLNKEKDNLKCCGNCGLPSRECYDEFVCKYVDARSPDTVCGDWKSDNLTKKERML